MRENEYQYEFVTSKMVSSVRGLLEQIIREAISFVKQIERVNLPKGADSSSLLKREASQTRKL